MSSKQKKNTVNSKGLYSLIFAVIALAVLVVTLLSLNTVPYRKFNVFGFTTPHNWYVDNRAACTSCDGRSWETAWKSLDSVVWGGSGVGPNDTVYISGSTTAYTGTLKIPQISSTSGDVITITKGNTAGHDSEVKIAPSSTYGLTVSGGQDIYISNLTFSDSTGIYINGGGTGPQGLVIDNCNFVNFKRAGVFIDSGDKITIKNSYFNDANENLFTSQSDGIYAQLATDLIVDHCTIILDNNYTANADLHSDNIQSYYVKNVTYSNNTLIQSSSKTTGTQMLFTEEGGQSDTNSGSSTLGTHMFVNNVLVRNCPNAADAAIRIKNGKGTYFKPRVFNNTYYGVSGRILNISTLPDPRVSNNLFIYTRSGDTIPATLDSTNIKGTTNPGFVNANFNYPSGYDFHLTSGSSAIDKGVSLTQYGISSDKDGKQRSGTWDLGAYEFGGSVIISTPKPLPTTAPNPTNTLIPTVRPSITPTQAPYSTPVPTVRPSVTPTRAPYSTPVPTVRPTIAPTRVPTPTSSYPVSGTTITIYAAGTPSSGIYPSMSLLVNGSGVAAWTNVRGDIGNRVFSVYTYRTSTRISYADVKVRFTNDAHRYGIDDRNLYIDKIVVNGVVYQTEASNVYSVGTYSSSGCSSGYRMTEMLSCNGYFLYHVR